MNIKDINDLIDLIDSNLLQLLKEYSSIQEPIADLEAVYRERLSKLRLLRQSLISELYQKLSKELKESIMLLINNDNKLEAVKLVKSLTGMTLMQSKRFVENV
jgi:ribosomal protein L7/L12